jgi:hypothetical protein
MSVFRTLVEKNPVRRVAAPYPCVARSAVVALITFTLLLAPTLSTASSIAVDGAAARPGSGTGCGGSGCGARLTLAGCTSTANVTVPDQTLSSSQTIEACNGITANNVDVGAGADVVFQAGESISLGSGFSVAAGASFTAVVDRGLTGDALVEDRNPSNETRYVARFYVNLDSMGLPTTEQLDHFVAYNGNGLVQFRLVFKHNDALGENRVFAEIRRDDGTFASNEGGGELVIPAGWHAVELDWTAATSNGANDGEIVVCLDDDGSRMGCEQVSSVDNDQGRVSRVQWGARAVGATTSGSFDMDDFDSRRAGPIGL